MGFNFYVGKQSKNNQAQPSAGEAKLSKDENQYYRKQFVSDLAVGSSKLINNLSSHILTMAGACEPLIAKFFIPRQ
eukprot:3294970-Ditylum_brightwellii.AAC.1